MPDAAQPAGRSTRVHAMTVDVEDYHTLMARFWMGREQPPTEAVVRNTRLVMELLAQHGARATFFVLGEVAATFPALIREIAAAGHEVGVHSHLHHPIFTQSPEQFRQDTARAKAAVEEAVGHRVRGYRAPAFSIVPRTRWALDILAELGFEYDSSVFPIKGRRYGWPGFALDIHQMPLDHGRRLIEAPLSTVRWLGRRWPACGGGYLRHFPAFWTRWAMRRVAVERPAIVYVHPHELDDRPITLDRSAMGLARGLRLSVLHRLQLRNRHTVRSKLAALMNEFTFAPLAEVIDDSLRLVDSSRGPHRPPR